MTTLRILVNGASGKMGQETVKAIQQDSALTLVASSDAHDNLAQAIATTRPDVVVDFTAPAAVFANATTIIQAGVRPVIGTTGLLPEQINTLSAACAEKRLGGIIAPNFSIAAILMMRFAKEAARYFPYVEIIEAHHEAKADSPSGTALKTAEMIAEGRQAAAPIYKTLRETVPGARGASYHGVPIHALRLPGVVAEQQVIFGGKGETLTIRDASIHRESYMPGVILACKKVMTLDQLVYGLEHII